ncbi:hypothetical protein V8E36_004138 [Tilletia maclaganii]
MANTIVRAARVAKTFQQQQQQQQQAAQQSPVKGDQEVGDVQQADRSLNGPGSRLNGMDGNNVSGGAGPSSALTSQPQKAHQQTETEAQMHDPGATRYRIEYMPIRRELKSAGGWDLEMVHEYLGTVLEGRGKAPRGISDLGSVDVTELTLSLRSRLQSEISYALNTLQILSTGQGLVVPQRHPPHPQTIVHQHVDFELDLSMCGDLTDELVELLTECVRFSPSPDAEVEQAVDGGRLRRGHSQHHGEAGPSSLANGLASAARGDGDRDGPRASDDDEQGQSSLGVFSHADWIEAAREHEFATKEWKRRRRPPPSYLQSSTASSSSSTSVDPRAGARLPDGTLLGTATDNSRALQWEARAERAVCLTFVLLNIFQNLSTRQINHRFLARHPTFLDRLAELAKTDERRMMAWKKGRRANAEGPGLGLRRDVKGKGRADESGIPNGFRFGSRHAGDESSMDVDGDDADPNHRDSEPSHLGAGPDADSNQDSTRSRTSSGGAGANVLPDTIFTPAELLRMRKEVLHIISNLSSSVDPPSILIGRTPDTVRAFFDLIQVFVVDATHFEDVALAQTEPILGPLNPDAVHLVVAMGIPEAVAVAAARSSRRVPQFCDLALEAFSRIALPDEHRHLLGQHIPVEALVRMGSVLVRMLPMTELDYGSLQAEARLAYVERTVLCLFNWACTATSRVKKRLFEVQPGTIAILWRLVRRLSAAHPNFLTNPFNVLVGRTVETMVVLGDVDDRFGATALLGMSGDGGVGAGGGGGSHLLGGAGGYRGRSSGAGDLGFDDDEAELPPAALTDPASISAALGKAMSAAERATKSATLRLGRRDREGPVLMGLEEEVAQVCSLPGMEDWIITNLMSMTGPGGL